MRRGPCAAAGSRPSVAASAGRLTLRAPSASPVISACIAAIVCSGGWACGASLAGDPSLPDDDDAVADMEDVGEAMADHQDRDAARLELLDQAHQHADLLGRQRRGRLVEEQQPRLELEGAGDGDELALAAGQRADDPVRLEVGAELAHHLPRRFAHADPVEEL